MLTYVWFLKIKFIARVRAGTLTNVAARLQPLMIDVTTNSDDDVKPKSISECNANIDPNPQTNPMRMKCQGNNVRIDGVWF